MIRCDHCGWSNNPDDAKKCQKCNQDLVVLPPVPVGGGYVEADKSAQSGCSKCAPSAADSSMKRTVRDLPSEMKEYRDVSADMKQTMRDVRTDAVRQTLKETSEEETVSSNVAGFRLRPIDVDAQGVFTFEADADAAFEYVDGKWCISENGGKDSVYVRAARRIALQKGDVVIIGGRRYIFE